MRNLNDLSHVRLHDTIIMATRCWIQVLACTPHVSWVAQHICLLRCHSGENKHREQISFRDRRNICSSGSSPSQRVWRTKCQHSRFKTLRVERVHLRVRRIIFFLQGGCGCRRWWPPRRNLNDMDTKRLNGKELKTHTLEHAYKLVLLRYM